MTMLVGASKKVLDNMNTTNINDRREAVNRQHRIDAAYLKAIKSLKNIWTKNFVELDEYLEKLESSEVAPPYQGLREINRRSFDFLVDRMVIFPSKEIRRQSWFQEAIPYIIAARISDTPEQAAYWRSHPDATPDVRTQIKEIAASYLDPADVNNMPNLIFDKTRCVNY